MKKYDRVGNYWTEANGYAICTMEGIKRFDFNDKSSFDEEIRKLESTNIIKVRRI
jgi:hypothetical protein